MAVELGRKHRVNVNGRTEVGPLVADDNGVGVQAGRKMFNRSHPGLYYIVKWADVTGYTMAAPPARMLGGSTINSHHTQLTLKTASNVYSWELSLSQQVLTARIGRYLAGLPNAAQ